MTSTEAAPSSLRALLGHLREMLSLLPKITCAVADRLDDDRRASGRAPAASGWSELTFPPYPALAGPDQGLSAGPDPVQPRCARRRSQRE